MLTSLRQTDLQKVLAADVTKTDGPFYCPKCKQETILRKGMVKVHHFAHKPPISCQYGKGESEHHRKCKSELYTYLSQYPGITCELEKDLGAVVPDIYIDQGAGKPKIALEIQISHLTMDRILQRTSAYHRLGIHVLWLVPYDAGIESDQYSPRAWEKWLHATYYGRVYYWVEKLSILPVHFSPYMLYVEESEWYESGGMLRTEGGYYRPSKRYRTPQKGKLLHLAQDFKAEKRRAWSEGSFVVPDCSILMDTQQKWWK